MRVTLLLIFVLVLLFDHISLVSCAPCVAADCAVGEYLSCDLECIACPAGHYCPYNDMKYACDAGDYNPHTGSFDPTECLSCPPGTYSDSSGSASCSLCDPGNWCGGGGSSMTACLNGFYADKAGMSACLECPAGHQCSDKTQAPVVCDVGEYADVQETSCSSCGDSEYSLVKGSVSCLVCEAGFKCLAGVGRSICPEGTFSGPGADACTPCSSGDYSLTEGSSSCTPCPPGFYCSAADQAPVPCPVGEFSIGGLDSCSSCTPPNYAPLPASSSCIPCPAGTVCVGAATDPSLCPVGQYLNAGACQDCPDGQSCLDPTKAPVDCPAGTFASGAAPRTECTECTLGTYKTTTGSGNCLACSSGSFCEDPAKDPIACPAGTHSTAPGSFCAPCDEGETSPGGTSTCTPCPAGSYCPRGDIDPIPCPEGFIAAGTGNIRCTPCSPGTYSDLARTSCDPCGIGSHCGNPLVGEVACPLGYVALNPSQEACAPCQAGFACPTAIAEAGCASGEYSYRGWPACLPCPVGMDCADPTHPVPCPDGEFSAAGVVGCSACAAGESCHQGLVVTCPPGYYSLDGDDACHLCEPGYECPNPDSMDSCDGTDGSAEWSPPGSSSCLPCPAGYRCPSPKHAPVVCPEGTYSLGDRTVCEECLQGEYCPSLDSGAPGFLLCQAGEFSSGGLRICGTCPAGFFCSSQITYNADVCPSGSYSLGGLPACTACPPGHYCDRPDEAPKPCPEGFYSGGGLAACVQCPTGSFCADATQDPPFACPLGTWSPPGAIECSRCAEGYVCAVGATSPNPAADICADGEFCDEGAIVERQCPGGTYGYSPVGPSGTEDRACDLCPPGFFCAGGAAILDCPDGSYCPAGTAAPGTFLCPAGTYRDTTGGASLSDCWLCPEGSVCSQGTIAPSGCLAGRYCPEGTTHNDQYPCPEGTYSAATGATSVATCVDCPAGSYCVEGSSTWTDCPEGTYNPDLGAGNPSRCLPCEPGYACTTVGMSDSTTTTCTAGYYCPRGTSNPSGYPCVAGTFSDAIDLHRVEDCEICHEGFSCAEHSVSSGMVSCPGGHYCPGADDLRYFGEYEGYFAEYPLQYPCPPGYYLNATESTHLENCTICPGGSFCRGGEGIISGACGSGHFCPEGTSSPTQFPCPPGTYTPSTSLSDSSSCTDCPEGSYCVGGSSDHSLCPAGSYVNVSNTIYAGPVADEDEDSCVICPPGFYCPPGTADPLGCSPGTYSSAQAVSCSTCLRGSYCLENTTFDNMITLYLCDAGTYCNWGMDSVPDPVVDACPSSYFCPEATDLPVPCPRGTYNDGVGLKNASECTVCPRGSYCVRGSASPTGLCDPGYYCPDGSEGPTQIPCPQRTYRNETGARSLADCWTCPSGFTCQIRSVDPSPCPGSFYCPVGSFEPVACTLGTYSNASRLSSGEFCTHCPAGQYCNGRGIKYPSGFCDQGFFCISKAHTSKPIDGETGGLCPRGGYCDAGSSFPTACQPGTYRNLTGGKTVDACLPCIPGYYCAGSNNVLPTAKCWAGYYCDGGAVNPKQHVTPVGHYTGVGSSQPIGCPKGTFANVTSMTSCLLCEPGFYCPTIGANNGTDCPPGHYCPSGSAFAVQCPRGRFSNATNLMAEDECSECPCGRYCESTGMTSSSGECAPGFYCLQGADEQSPVARSFGDLCPAGHYCPSGSCSPRSCPPGTYLSSRGRSALDDCVDCLPGFYCPRSNMTNSTTYPCFSGSFCVGGASNGSQFACPVGQYCPPNSPIGIPCNEATFANVTGLSACDDCPEAYHCVFGAVDPMPCPVGRYCPFPSGTHPPQCPAGTFRNVTGGVSVDDCELCPGGRYCSVSGLAEANGLCLAGYYCVRGATNDVGDVIAGGESGTCPTGHYCPVGTAVPKKCPPGTYLNDEGKSEVTHCLLCRPGEYCNDTGLALPVGSCLPGFYCPIGSASPSEVPCPAGSYCPLGSAFPTFCDPGTFASAEASPLCEACPSGSFCPINTSTPLDCPMGFYCPLGTGSVRLDIACLEGTFGNATNLGSASDCHQCSGGMFCAFPGLVAPSGFCAPGYYCQSGAIDDMGRVVEAGPASLCPVGNFCPPGSALPRPCPEGTLSDELGNTNLSHCLPCTPGSYCGSEGLSVPTSNCSGGYYCVRRAAVADPTDGVTGDICPLGSFCPPGSSTHILCSDGSFANDTGFSECYLCPPGFYCLLGEAFPRPCPPGQYCLEGSGVQRRDCPVGTSFSGTGIAIETDCEPCSPGKACTAVGLVLPNADCQAGYFCPNSSVKITGEPFGGPCPPGTYCPSSSANASVCPSGTYNPLAGSIAFEDCVACPPARYCELQGQSTFTGDCDGGYYCPPGQSSPRPPGYECPVGFYCRVGTSDPKGCPAGTFQNETGQTSCRTCPAGSFCLENCSSPIVCPIDYFCPEGVSLPVRCPDGTYGDDTGLMHSSECAICPNGTFCVAGQIAGDCFAGHLCSVGNEEPTPISKEPVGGLCPIGFWCDVGTIDPTPCPNGTFGTNEGGRDIHICGPCPAGSECMTVDMTPLTVPCSVGHYCPFNTPPIECPIGTYNDLLGAPDEKSCLPCDAGYLCPSIGIVSPSLECPRGSFCPPGSIVPIPCPLGTYNNFSRGVSVALSCLECPAGFYCNDTFLPDDCIDGEFCLTGSHLPRDCPPGYYCPDNTSEPIVCPAGFYCPIRSEFPVVCLEDYFYCPAGMDRPLPCPVGYVMRNLSAVGTEWRKSLSDVCVACSPGFYGNVNRTACKICSVGHVCLSAATSPIPTDIVTQRGYICPAGHLCPAGSGVATPCPAGEFQPEVGMGKCDLCPSNHYIDVKGSTFCRVCGSNSKDLPHRQNCECKGFGRTYQKSDGHCLCRPGYVHYEENRRQEMKDSAVDCQEIVYTRCSGNSVRSAISGECVSRLSCDEFCSVGNSTVRGSIDSNGMCSCQRVVNENEVCDSLCRHEQRKLVFDPASQSLRVRNGKTGHYEAEFPSLVLSGTVSCLQETECPLSVIEITDLGIKGLYDVSVDYFTDLLNGTTSDVSRRAVTAANPSSTGIYQPLVCLNYGEALLFHIPSKGHYPKYLKDSLLNTNADFDYGEFRRLENAMKSNLSVSTFAFQFQDVDIPGTYVFYDAATPAWLTVVSLMESEKHCPGSASFVPLSSSNLVLLGISEKSSLLLSPDWILVVALFVSFLLFFFVLVAGLKYLLSDRWTEKEAPRARFRRSLNPATIMKYGLLDLEMEDLYLRKKKEDQNEELVDLEDFHVENFYRLLANHKIQMTDDIARYGDQFLDVYHEIMEDASLLKSMMVRKYNLQDLTLDVEDHLKGLERYKEQILQDSYEFNSDALDRMIAEFRSRRLQLSDRSDAAALASVVESTEDARQVQMFDDCRDLSLAECVRMEELLARRKEELRGLDDADEFEAIKALNAQVAQEVSRSRLSKYLRKMAELRDRLDKKRELQEMKVSRSITKVLKELLNDALASMRRKYKLDEGMDEDEEDVGFDGDDDGATDIEGLLELDYHDDDFPESDEDQDVVVRDLERDLKSHQKSLKLHHASELVELENELESVFDDGVRHIDNVIREVKDLAVEDRRKRLEDRLNYGEFSDEEKERIMSKFQTDSEALENALADERNRQIESLKARIERKRERKKKLLLEVQKEEISLQTQLRHKDRDAVRDLLHRADSSDDVMMFKTALQLKTNMRTSRLEAETEFDRVNVEKLIDGDEEIEMDEGGLDTDNLVDIVREVQFGELSAASSEDEKAAIMAHHKVEMERLGDVLDDLKSRASRDLQIRLEEKRKRLVEDAANKSGSRRQQVVEGKDRDLSRVRDALQAKSVVSEGVAPNSESAEPTVAERVETIAEKMDFDQYLVNKQCEERFRELEESASAKTEETLSSIEQEERATLEKMKQKVERATSRRSISAAEKSRVLEDYKRSTAEVKERFQLQRRAQIDSIQARLAEKKREQAEIAEREKNEKKIEVLSRQEEELMKSALDDRESSVKIDVVVKTDPEEQDRQRQLQKDHTQELESMKARVAEEEEREIALMKEVFEAEYLEEERRLKIRREDAFVDEDEEEEEGEVPSADRRGVIDEFQKNRIALQQKKDEERLRLRRRFEEKMRIKREELRQKYEDELEEVQRRQRKKEEALRIQSQFDAERVMISEIIVERRVGSIDDAISAVLGPRHQNELSSLSQRHEEELLASGGESPRSLEKLRVRQKEELVEMRKRHLSEKNTVIVECQKYRYLFDQTLQDEEQKMAEELAEFERQLTAEKKELQQLAQKERTEVRAHLEEELRQEKEQLLSDAEKVKQNLRSDPGESQFVDLLVAEAKEEAESVLQQSLAREEQEQLLAQHQTNFVNFEEILRREKQGRVAF